MGGHRILSLKQARRIALAAQGLSKSRKEQPVTARKIVNTIDGIAQLQIDSVNVVRRAHYMPIFARLGAYDISTLDQLLAKPRSPITEYWAHEASVISAELIQDLRVWQRRTWNDRSAGFSTEQHELSARVMQYLKEHPGSSARQISQALDVAPVEVKTHWGWNWNDTKYVTESLFAQAQILTLGRNSQFERRYALAGDVVELRPEIDAPHRHEALTRLVARALKALGVATAHCVAEYFRLPIREAKEELAAQALDGLIEEVQIQGISEPCYLQAGTKIPRKIDRDLRLLSPFDSMVFNLRRLEKFFDFEYRIEIYVPEKLRRYGYYVFPMLHGEEFVGRVDLKADRSRSVLHAKQVHYEPGVDSSIESELRAELERMARWLELDQVEIGL
ncbi:winged helix-turn-helix domain-containing protein [Glutamicibacter arilaitensis]|uniref:winged helix-turn-helix domain-containing protein n=1 Tax=Glutamicibacter arilaitensis TaxID=256701 RepID=UPI003F917D22